MHVSDDPKVKPAAARPSPVVEIQTFAPRAGRPSVMLHFQDDVLLTPDLLSELSETLSAGGYEVTLNTGAASDAQPPEHGAGAPARARGEARLVHWTRDGTLVEGSALEAAWGLKRQSVSAARERGEIFSLWVKGQHWYPHALLQFERAQLAAINRALGDTDPSSKLVFFTRRHGALDGMTVADATAAGRLDAVLRVAGEWARP